MFALALLAACSGGPASPPPSPLPTPTADARPEAIYFVLVDRFANGDPSNDGQIDPGDPQAFHGGDLRGVIDHLDHIEGLGFTSIWLSPVWRMRTDKLDEWGAFHGYWVLDPTEVEPRFGDEATLRELSDALHARGMRLYLDVVWNHVSFDSPLRTERPDWFHPSRDIVDWDDPVQRVTHEVHGLPDLAQENPEVEAWLSETALGWVERANPDGFRVDAVRHMPLDFQARMAERTRAASTGDFRLVGEVFDGDPSRLAADWRGGGFDHVFDFPLRYAMIDFFCHGAHPGRLAATLASDTAYPDASGLVTMLDNHDVSRLMSECGGDTDKAGAALDFLFASRGIPSMTYGTEVGLEGAEEPHNRRDMRFVEHALQDRIRTALAQRAQHPVLADGQTRIVALDSDRLVLLRADGDHAVEVEVTATGVRVVESQARAQPLQSRTVNIRVDGLPEGATAVLAGSASALGAWSADAAPPVTDGTASLTVQAPTVLEYKLVLRAETDTWQEGGNHYLFVPAGDGPLQASHSWP